LADSEVRAEVLPNVLTAVVARAIISTTVPGTIARDAADIEARPNMATRPTIPPLVAVRTVAPAARAALAITDAALVAWDLARPVMDAMADSPPLEPLESLEPPPEMSVRRQTL
jgi:hypothetical protein